MNLLNVALPLFIVEWWFVFLALIVVVLIESTILAVYLSTNYFTVAKWVFKANLISTLGGYILQSLARFFIGLIVFISVPDINDPTGVLSMLAANIGIGKYQGGWKNPTILYNFVIALSICFILSISIESRLIRKYAGQHLIRKDLWKAVILGNIIS